jgi:hypothetical protein
VVAECRYSVLVRKIQHGSGLLHRAVYGIQHYMCLGCRDLKVTPCPEGPLPFVLPNGLSVFCQAKSFAWISEVERYSHAEEGSTSWRAR